MPRKHVCQLCGKELVKRKTESQLLFFIRKYCSPKCRQKGMAKTLDRRIKKSKGRHKDG